MAWFEVQTMLEHSTSLCSVQNNDTGCTAKTQERQIVLIVQYNPAGAAFSFSGIYVYSWLQEEYYFLMYYTGMGEIQRQTKRTAN